MDKRTLDKIHKIEASIENLDLEVISWENKKKVETIWETIVNFYVKKGKSKAEISRKVAEVLWISFNTANIPNRRNLYVGKAYLTAKEQFLDLIEGKTNKTTSNKENNLEDKESIEGIKNVENVENVKNTEEETKETNKEMHKEPTQEQKESTTDTVEEKIQEQPQEENNVNNNNLENPFNDINDVFASLNFWNKQLSQYSLSKKIWRANSYTFLE